MARSLDAAHWHEACGRKDPEAWERLHGFLLGLSRKIALAFAEADRHDLVQKVLLEAWQSHPKTDPEAWIPNTVMRLKSRTIDHHRRRSASVVSLDGDPDTGPAWRGVSSDNPEKSVALRQALTIIFAAAHDHVGERCTRLLDLYFRLKAGSDPELQTIDDVAARFGVTTNNASVSLHRCLKKLRAVPRVAEVLEGVVGG